jgi:formylmethanofuran dehydrogenase subunit E
LNGIEDVVKLAASLHGHLSPGVALGIRMGQIGLKKLGLPKGDKRLFAVVETTLCLADGVQASTGCTPGHVSMRVEDFGKLAFCLARSDTKSGVRVILKRHGQSRLINDWMMRKKKIGHGDEEGFAEELLNLDDSSFQVEEVTVEPFSKFDESEIIECEKCGELVAEAKAVRKQGKNLCKACSGLKYYTRLVKGDEEEKR